MLQALSRRKFLLTPAPRTSACYVPLDQLTSDPTAKPEDIVKIGDELELMVVRVNDVEGTAMLSKTRLDAVTGFEKVMNAGGTGRGRSPA